MGEIFYNIPKNTENLKGEFIVFFSADENPEILFHSMVADEAYKKAEEIFQQKGVRPTVTLVQEKENNIAQVIAFAKFQNS
jgi:hypothetical protein